MRSVLVVEDEPLLGSLLKQRLERDGFQVTLARDGEAALSALKESTPDLVLLDVILPKMSGFEVLENINADPELSAKGVPVVIVSNLGQEGDVERARLLGVIGYFVKAQFSFEEVVGQIKKFFDR